MKITEIIIVLGLYAKPGKDPDLLSCPTTGHPANSIRQANLLDNSRPLFRLDIKAAKDGYLPKETYHCKYFRGIKCS